jgi:hypothetical protein
MFFAGLSKETGRPALATGAGQDGAAGRSSPLETDRPGRQVGAAARDQRGWALRGGAILFSSTGRFCFKAPAGRAPSSPCRPGRAIVREAGPQAPLYLC